MENLNDQEKFIAALSMTSVVGSYIMHFVGIVCAFALPDTVARWLALNAFISFVMTV